MFAGSNDQISRKITHLVTFFHLQKSILCNIVYNTQKKQKYKVNL